MLAKNVLTGNIKGYKNHPQLLRFKNTENPLNAINQYLSEVYHEASQRNYNFNREKIDWNFQPIILTVTQGQVEYEKNHLLKKLQMRDPQKFEKIKASNEFSAHPIFEVAEGEIEEWEIITNL